MKIFDDSLRMFIRLLATARGNVGTYVDVATYIHRQRRSLPACFRPSVYKVGSSKTSFSSIPHASAALHEVVSAEPDNGRCGRGSLGGLVFH